METFWRAIGSIKRVKTHVLFGLRSRRRRRNVIQGLSTRRPRSYPRTVTVRQVQLLVVAGMGLSASIDTHEPVGEFVSPFDRTIFVDAYEGKCLVLDTRPPAIPARPGEP
jgi:hypothetical protein